MRLKNTFASEETTYPGRYIPKNQMMKALSEGLFEMNKVNPEPKINISETNEYVKVELSHPGIKRENLLVSVNEKGTLCIMGYESLKEHEGKHHAGKRSQLKKAFLNEISLPENADPCFTSAACHAGLLSIFISKSDKPVNKRPTTIVVY